MSNPSKPVIRKPAQGRTVAVVGDVYRFLATGEDTNGKYALWEAIVPPGGGPPSHVHSREEEGFYVLEGEITLTIGEKRLVASAGMFANMPVGTPHSFKNEGSRPARMLISVAPVGLKCANASLPDWRTWPQGLKLLPLSVDRSISGAPPPNASPS